MSVYAKRSKRPQQRFAKRELQKQDELPSDQPTSKQHPVEHRHECPNIASPISMVQPTREREQARSQLGKVGKERSERYEKDGDDSRTESDKVFGVNGGFEDEKEKARLQVRTMSDTELGEKNA